MAEVFPSRFSDTRPPADTHVWVEPLAGVRRQYARVREFYPASIDELVNSSEAKSRLRQLWLLASMVSNPRKAECLPPWSMK